MPLVNPKRPQPKLTPKGRATRDRIVAVAAKLVFERGVAGTSVEDVRAASNVSYSQLYHYFVDKMALVRAVIALQTETILEGQAVRLDSMAALRSWRDSLVDYQRRAHCQGGCPLGSLSTELAEVSTEARTDLSRSFERWEELIRTGLNAMHRDGTLRADADPDRLALAVLAAVQGGLVLTQVRRDPAPLAAALDAVLNYIESLTVGPGS